MGAKWKFPLGLFAFLAFAGMVFADSDWQVVKVRGRDYLTVDNIAKFYGLPIGVAPVDKHLRIENSRNSVEFQLDSREVMINGVRNWLCFPVTEKNGQYLVSRVDLAKTLEPELRPQLAPAGRPSVQRDRRAAAQVLHHRTQDVQPRGQSVPGPLLQPAGSSAASCGGRPRKLTCPCTGTGDATVRQRSSSRPPPASRLASRS